MWKNLRGSYVQVAMQARPISVCVNNDDGSFEALLGSPVIHRLEFQDFVFYKDAEKIRPIWLKSLKETSTAVFQEIPADLSADERVLLAAEAAANKIDHALTASHVGNKDFPIPESYDLILHPKDANIRRETIETLVPFNRIRELLLKREELGLETQESPLGLLSFSVSRFAPTPSRNLN